MSGSKEGYQKAREKLLQRYGGEEGLKRHQQEIGSRGGFRVTPKTKTRGFGSMDKDKLKEAAARGGRAKRD